MAKLWLASTTLLYHKYLLHRYMNASQWTLYPFFLNTHNLHQGN